MEKSLGIISRAKSLVGSIRALGNTTFIAPNTLQIGFSQANLPQNSTTSFKRNHSLEIGSDSLPILTPAGPTFSEADVAAAKFSPSGAQRALLRKKEKSLLLEIWDETGLRCSKACDDVHESTVICLPSMAFENIQWSMNEKRIMYLAEKKIPAKKTYGDELKTEDDLKALEQSYTYEKDLGEKLDGKINFVLVIWDLNSDANDAQKLAPASTVVDLTSDRIMPTYPQFVTEDGFEILLGGVKYNEHKLSLVFCMNRPAKIYLLTAPLVTAADKEKKAEEEKDKKPEEKKAKRWCLRQVSHEDHQVAIIPFLSKDRTKAYYHFNQKIPTMHNFYVGLAEVDLSKANDLLKEKVQESTEGEVSAETPSKAVAELFQVQQKPGKEFNGFCGMPDTLEKRIWISQEEYITEAINNCNSELFIVNVVKKEVRKASLENTSSEEWRLQSDWPEQQVLFASRNSLVSGTTLMAYSTKTNQWKEIPLPNLVNQLPKKYDALWAPVEKNLIQGRMTKEVNGVQVEGFYYCLASAANQKPLEERRIVVIIHGGPHSCSTIGPTTLKRLLLESGYVIASVNYSGSSGYSQAHMEGLLGKAGVKDLNEIEEWVIELSKTKKLGSLNDVWGYGGSYGGYMGWRILTEAQKIKFKGAAILNPVTDILSVRILSDIPEWSCNVFLGTDQILNVSDEDYMELYRKAPIRFAEKVEGKVGLFVGLKDRRCAPEPSLAMYRTMKELGKDIFLRVYEDNHALGATPSATVDQLVHISRLFEMEDNL